MIVGMAQREINRQNGEILRQRRRERIAFDIERAALRLIADKGFDAVTVEEIAAAAEISGRTFFRYYASKDDVVMGDRRRRAAAFQATLASRPPEEPLTLAFRHAACAMLDEASSDREVRRLRERVMKQLPRLQVRAYDHSESELDTIIAVVAQRMGVDPHTDWRPAVIMEAVAAAIRAAAARSDGRAGDPHLRSRVLAALDLLAVGFDQVASDRARSLP